MTVELQFGFAVYIYIKDSPFYPFEGLIGVKIDEIFRCRIDYLNPGRFTVFPVWTRAFADLDCIGFRDGIRLHRPALSRESS
jgi:hypothetical protein